ncbi:MAG: hypothetical protein G01um101470_479 [Parcubacteria group bacterium Gr01-1014_70]|nr:MAG: hypothetical protein G01um101470_479 [Parcubacteria group bacterium Gr01-1014_70]
MQHFFCFNREHSPHTCACSSVVERCPDKTEAEGSIPSTRTIREFWRLMQGADAVLVMNFDKHGVKNYIGGNTLMEIGFAHVLDQKIFLYNPIPEIPYYKSEIEAVKPIIISGDLSKL